MVQPRGGTTGQGPAAKEPRRQGTKCPTWQMVPLESGAYATLTVLPQTTAKAAVCPESFLTGGRKPCLFPGNSTPVSRELISPKSALGPGPAQPSCRDGAGPIHSHSGLDFDPFLWRRSQSGLFSTGGHVTRGPWDDMLRYLRAWPPYYVKTHP